MKKEIKVPTEQDINKVAKMYDNHMPSSAESFWMPQGFKEGANWVIDKILELNK